MPTIAVLRFRPALLLGLLSVAAGCGDGSTPAPVASPPETSASVVEPSSVEWRDVTDEIGVDFVHRAGPGDDFAMPAIMAGGGAVFDADGDGRLDLYFTNGEANAFYLQRGDGTFEDATRQSGLGDPGYGMGAAVGDIDNDGDLDLFASNYGADALYRNLGDGRFERASEAGIADPGWSTSATFLDYDRDGWLDLFVARYVRFDPNRECRSEAGLRDFCGPAQFPGQADLLYRNLGGGRFEEVSREAGIAVLEDAGLGVLAADFDEDGWIDVYVANDADPNHLWINQGDGTFVEDGMLVGLAFNRYGVGEAGMGVVGGDGDGDGDLDVFVTHLIEETNTYYENRGAAGFEDATALVGLALSSVPYTSFGTVFFDYDNDGDLDLAVANGGVKRRPTMLSDRAEWPLRAYAEPNLLFENRGGRFEDVSSSAAAFTAPVEASRGLLTLDLESDGDLDLVMVNVGGRARVVRNEGRGSQPAAGHWLALDVRDPRLGRQALGARLLIEAGGARLVRHALPAGGYLSGSEPTVHVGLGEASHADRVEVTWPGGLVEEFGPLEAGRQLTLERGSGRRKDDAADG